MLSLCFEFKTFQDQSKIETTCGCILYGDGEQINISRSTNMVVQCPMEAQQVHWHEMAHYEVWKYCQTTSKAHAEVLQNHIVWLGTQGILWVKEREAKNNLKVVRMGAPDTTTKMERAIEAGHSVLIENMGETIDAVLNPVITRSTFKKVSRSYEPVMMRGSLSTFLLAFEKVAMKHRQA